MAIETIEEHRQQQLGSSPSSSYDDENCYYGGNSINDCYNYCTTHNSDDDRSIPSCCSTLQQYDMNPTLTAATTIMPSMIPSNVNFETNIDDNSTTIGHQHTVLYQQWTVVLS